MIFSIISATTLSVKPRAAMRDRSQAQRCGPRSKAMRPSSASAVKNWIVKNGLARRLVVHELGQRFDLVVVQRVGDQQAHVERASGASFISLTGAPAFAKAHPDGA